MNSQSKTLQLAKAYVKILEPDFKSISLEKYLAQSHESYLITFTKPGIGECSFQVTEKTLSRVLLSVHHFLNLESTELYREDCMSLCCRVNIHEYGTAYFHSEEDDSFIGLSSTMTINSKNDLPSNEDLNYFIGASLVTIETLAGTLNVEIEADKQRKIDVKIYRLEIKAQLEKWIDLFKQKMKTPEQQFTESLKRMLSLRYIVDGLDSDEAAFNIFWDTLIFKSIFKLDSEKGIKALIEYIIFQKYESYCEMDLLYFAINEGLENLEESYLQMCSLEKIRRMPFYSLLNYKSKDLINKH